MRGEGRESVCVACYLLTKNLSAVIRRSAGDASAQSSRARGAPRSLSRPLQALVRQHVIVPLAGMRHP